jgi:hypothetical protein
MAFDKTKLTPLARGGGFTLWHYNAGDDDADAVNTAGYFNAVYDLVNKNDLIICLNDSGASIGIFKVSAKAAGSLTTTDNFPPAESGGSS